MYHTQIYRAKWWTQADVPEADVDGTGASPWTLVGQGPDEKKPDKVEAEPRTPSVPDRGGRAVRSD